MRRATLALLASVLASAAGASAAPLALTSNPLPWRARAERKAAS